MDLLQEGENGDSRKIVSGICLWAHTFDINL